MRWLVTGASGSLGSYLLRELREQDNVVAWSGTTTGERFGRTFHAVDLADANALATAFAAARPDFVIHAGALARVDACFREPEHAQRINAGSTRELAGLCDPVGARLVLVSTDLVFDGERAPYRESDPPNALSSYGRSKAAGEEAVVAASRGVVARVSLMYGSAINGRPGHFDMLLEALQTGRTTTLFADEWRTPLALSTAASALVALAESDVTGTIHIGGPERMSRLEMGRRLGDRLSVSVDCLIAGARNASPGVEPRPRDVSLDSSRWRALFPAINWPRLEDATI